MFLGIKLFSFACPCLSLGTPGLWLGQLRGLLAILSVYSYASADPHSWYDGLVKPSSEFFCL